MYDTGYGGKSIGYGRDRISEFPMRKPSARGMKIPISADDGHAFAVIFMSVVGILAITLFWTYPLFWVIVFVAFSTWFIEWEESLQYKEEEVKAEEEESPQINDHEKSIRFAEEARKLALKASRDKNLSFDVIETTLYNKLDSDPE